VPPRWNTEARRTEDLVPRLERHCPNLANRIKHGQIRLFLFV
jgi:hypothetical protein